MTKLAPEWVRTSDPVIRSPARYRWTTAPASISMKSWPNVKLSQVGVVSNIAQNHSSSPQKGVFFSIMHTDDIGQLTRKDTKCLLRQSVHAQLMRGSYTSSIMRLATKILIYMKNKATRSPEISRQKVQKLTPPFSNQNKGMEDILDVDSHCPYLLSGETTFHLTLKNVPPLFLPPPPDFFLKMLEIV